MFAYYLAGNAHKYFYFFHVNKILSLETCNTAVVWGCTPVGYVYI